MFIVSTKQRYLTINDIKISLIQIIKEIGELTPTDIQFIFSNEELSIWYSSEGEGLKLFKKQKVSSQFSIFDGIKEFLKIQPSNSIMFESYFELRLNNIKRKARFIYLKNNNKEHLTIRFILGEFN